MDYLKNFFILNNKGYFIIHLTILYLFTTGSTSIAQSDTISIDPFFEKSAVVSEIVVTGTKTFKRKTDSPVIVNILDSKTLGNL